MLVLSAAVGEIRHTSDYPKDKVKFLNSRSSDVLQSASMILNCLASVIKILVSERFTSLRAGLSKRILCPIFSEEIGIFSQCFATGEYLY